MDLLRQQLVDVEVLPYDHLIRRARTSIAWQMRDAPDELKLKSPRANQD